MNDGLFTKLHQNYLFGTYDTLYGQNYIHNENSIPVASNLKLGTK